MATQQLVKESSLRAHLDPPTQRRPWLTHVKPAQSHNADTEYNKDGLTDCGGKGGGVCICVFICWASFEIKGLCPVLNKNGFWFMPVHSCVAECAWNVGYTRHWGASVFEDVPLVEFMYLVFTRMPCESYRRRLRSLLLYWCVVFRTLINSLVCWLSSFRIQVNPACQKIAIPINSFPRYLAICLVSKLNTWWTTACNTVRFITQEHVFT